MRGPAGQKISNPWLGIWGWRCQVIAGSSPSRPPVAGNVAPRRHSVSPSGSQGAASSGTIGAGISGLASGMPVGTPANPRIDIPHAAVCQLSRRWQRDSRAMADRLRPLPCLRQRWHIPAGALPWRWSAGSRPCPARPGAVPPPASVRATGRARPIAAPARGGASSRGASENPLAIPTLIPSTPGDLPLSAAQGGGRSYFTLQFCSRLRVRVGEPQHCDSDEERREAGGVGH